MNRIMRISQIISWENIEFALLNILKKIHTEWPLSWKDFEFLSYCKKLHPDVFKQYEHKLIYLMGLFYKTSSPEGLIEEIYSIFAESIKEESWWKSFTPFQWDAYKKINNRTYFSFSAPTSTWKSYLFMELILETEWDIIIVVPSRALIAEYMYKVTEIVKENKNILVLPFLDNINIKNTIRRIFIITPERWVELFKLKDSLNIQLFLFDEAQISEEKIRWMQFDTFVRRSDSIFPDAKKVFAHPFVNNPEAQLKKHKFDERNSDAISYGQLSVWKIFLAFSWKNFSYFSPYDTNREIEQICTKTDIINEVLKVWWTILIYISKSSIYNNEYIEKYKRYIDNCPKLTSPVALTFINKLKEFIGSSDENSEKHSSMIDMMEKWIVIHHWSIPLKARYIIEDFIKNWFAKICFSTATLLQWINMPFDVVWIDNFRFSWISDKEDEKILNLKNLIWRAWRSKNLSKSTFDYWFVVIDEANLKTFSKRIRSTISISPISKLDEIIDKVPEDNIDMFDAFKEGWFDDNLYLPNNQIERIQNADISRHLVYILDNLLVDNMPIKWKDYTNLGITKKNKIKWAFKNIFTSHLRRKKLWTWELSVLSTSISILLWKIQWKTFKEIIWLRQAYISKKDEQLKIKYDLRDKKITISEARDKMIKIKLEFSQPAEALPNSLLKRCYPLFKDNNLYHFKYDVLVYDTYDYLDKVLTYSLVNPLSAAFHIFYEKTKDERALIMENYIRYWTNEKDEIMLLRYWFSFEEIEWLKEYVEIINENEIVFKSSISDLDSEQFKIVSRYL